jgi:hypothetical protein
MSLARLTFPTAVEDMNLLRRHWAVDGGMGVCSSDKGGSPRVSFASTCKSTGYLSSLIWLEYRVPEGSDVWVLVAMFGLSAFA